MNRIMLGLGVAIAAAFSVIAATQFVGQDWFDQHRHNVGIGVAATGLVTFLFGLWLRRRIGEDIGDEGGKLSLFDLRYWGPILIVLGAITFFIRPMHELKAQVVAVASKPAPALPPPPPPAPTFPSVRIQGLFIRQSQPFAIIDGDSYTIGDRVGGATVKAINRDGVELEIAGITKLVMFNDTTGGRVAFSREGAAR